MKRLLRLTAAPLVLLALAPPIASADQVYHSEHLNFEAVGVAPLRAGFVQNIKAQGPRVYAHEIVVLNGARARTVYVVTRLFFVGAPKCGEGFAFSSDVATLQTNASGNGKADVFVRPADVAGFEGEHGVMWTVRGADGAVAYRTSCTAVTLD